MKPRQRLLVAGASSLGLCLLAPANPLRALARTKDTAVEVAALRTEYKENPLGLGIAKPR
jgi:hypothetical protein